MNYIDYIIIAFALIGFLLGFKDGLIRKIIGLIGLIAGIALAFEFSDKIGKFLTPFFNNDEYLAGVISGILIFLIIVFIASIIKRIVHPLDKLNKFINQFIGGLIGIIQIVFFLSAIFLFMDIFKIPDDKSRKDSILYSTVYDLIPNTIDLVIGHRAKATDIIKNFIESQDTIVKPLEDSTQTENYDNQ